jgi:PST family polysaccharide transporter
MVASFDSFNLEYRTFRALLAIVVSPTLLFFFSFYFINKEIDILNQLAVPLLI